MMRIPLPKSLLIIACSVFLTTGLKCTLFAAALHDITRMSATQAVLSEAARDLSQGFTENKGQIVDTDGRYRSDVLYVYHAKDVSVFFRENGWSYVFSRPDWNMAKDVVHLSRASSKYNSAEHYRVDIEFVPSFAAETPGTYDAPGVVSTLTAIEQIPGYSHHYTSNRRDGVTFVRQFGKLRYNNVYSGIDVEFYFDSQGLKYDVIISSYVNPGKFCLVVKGASRVSATEPGGVLIASPGGSITEEPPIAYQHSSMTFRDPTEVAEEFESIGKRADRSRTVSVACKTVVKNSEISFDVGPYDRSCPLIIDPVLTWATYYGGNELDSGSDIAVDASGNMYMTGKTNSADFPVSPGAWHSGIGGGYEAYIVKFSPNGSRFWATFYGGIADENSEGITLDDDGSVYVTGFTLSEDFPVSENAFQIAWGGSKDAFLLKLSNDGIREWATVIGGDGNDCGMEITRSGSDVYITGFTASTDFPISAGAFQSNLGGSDDAFLMKFTSDGKLQWSTFVGGDRSDVAYAIDKNNAGVVIAGQTQSLNFPLADAYQSTNQGENDNFISVFKSDGSMEWSTYFGGRVNESVFDVAVDGHDDIYITGETFSKDFETTAGAFQTINAGRADAFLVKLSPAGSLLWSTLYGGNTTDHMFGVTTDKHDNPIIVGYTRSTDFPVTADAFQVKLNGGYEGCIVAFDQNGQRLWATFYGGNMNEGCRSVVTDAAGNLMISGEVTSSNFPLLNPYQSTFGGGSWDAFIISFTALNPEKSTIKSSALNNYPNPFNPATKIQLTVDATGPVTLRVFDVLGKCLQILLDEWRTAGEHEIFFDAGVLSGGTYFLVLTTAESTAVRNIVVLK